MHLIGMYKDFLMEHGRATRVLRKSKLFCPFLKHCLTQADNEMYSIGPVQYDIYVMMKYAIVGGSLPFVKKLIKHNILRLLFERIDKCPYDCMIVLFDAIGQSIILLAKYKEDEELKDSIVEIIKDCYLTLLKRAISIDFSKNELKSGGIFSPPAKSVEVASTFAEIFVYLQVYFRLPTHAKLKIKIKRFAMEFAAKYKQNASFNEDLGCTQEEMMDMRNNANFSCYKLLTFDYSKDEVARERKLAKESMDRNSDDLEQERNVNINCGFCKKEEPEDVLFARCAKCRMVYYCNRDCQVKGWKSHKRVCKALPKTSLKEPLLNFAESIEQMNKSSAMPAGATIYPTIFAVWLEEKYDSKNQD